MTHTIRYVSGDSSLLSDLPPRAVSLDGYVQGPALGDAEDRWSFDHHAGCIRLFTAATCEQVRAAICLGFSFAGREVYVNDLDGDTLLSLWLISNPSRANEDGVRALVRAVGCVDAHGPAGNLMLSEAERRLVTLFHQQAIEPVTRLRGKVREEFDRWGTLVDVCLNNVDALLNGQLTGGEPEVSPVAIEHETMIGTYRACIGTCDGFGFTQLYDQGFDVAVLHRDAADGSRTYTVAKRSDLVKYDLAGLLGRLAAREPGWGGGSSIGGSPRLPGGVSSRLGPEEVWTEVLR